MMNPHDECMGASCGGSDITASFNPHTHPRSKNLDVEELVQGYVGYCLGTSGSIPLGDLLRACGKHTSELPRRTERNLGHLPATLHPSMPKHNQVISLRLRCRKPSVWTSTVCSAFQGALKDMSRRVAASVHRCSINICRWSEWTTSINPHGLLYNLSFPAATSNRRFKAPAC